MALDFDTYLIDEVTGAGDKSFVEKSRAVFASRVAGASAIFVSHSMPMLRRMCTAGAVLHDGQLEYFDDLEAAISLHETLLKRNCA
jgi:capsular polysaccharide transport system ATP-binding protein